MLLNDILLYIVRLPGTKHEAIQVSLPRWSPQGVRMHNLSTIHLSRVSIVLLNHTQRTEFATTHAPAQCSAAMMANIVRCMARERVVGEGQRSSSSRKGSSVGLPVFFLVIGSALAGTFWTTIAPVGAEVVGIRD